MKKICVVTGTRAEYGLLSWTMKEIEKSGRLKLQLIATGTHLADEFGMTCNQIEADGFKIDEKLNILSGQDTAVAVAHATAKGLELFATAFNKLQPDLILVLGDRYEILAAVSAALFLKIPVAHIGGGDTTEGAIDESIRHSLTKMSHLHFVTNESAAKRVRQLGENPKNIFNVGNPGLEHLAKTQLLSRAELENDLQIRFKEKVFVVTFHPVTLETGTAERQINELLLALGQFLQDQKTTILFTKSNADSDNHVINAGISRFVQAHPDCRFFASLGTKRYLSLLAQVSVVIGNSSSGLTEAPSFKVPTVNIGDRQKGRLSAPSVIDARPVAAEITEAITKALTLDCSKVINPYGSADTSVQICKILETESDYQHLLKKHFHEL